MLLKNLLRRKVRTLLSLLGVAIGIAAIVAFNAVGRGFKGSIDRMMRETGAQLLVVNKMMKDPAFSRVSAEEQEFIRGLPQVEHLSPGTFTLASPRGLDMKEPVDLLLVWGRDPGDRLLGKFRRSLEGRIMESEDEAMLGTLSARALGLGPGDTMKLFERSFTVAGVYESGVQMENVGIIVANSVIQRQLSMGGAAAMAFLFLREGADWRETKAAIEGKYERLQALRTEEFTAFYDQLRYIDWFVWIISLVSVAIGGLGVLNTMLMSVSERTREIGTLRAVGWSRKRVLGLVLGEGLLISAAGGLAGLVGGAAGAALLIRWAPAGLDAEYAPFLFVEAFGVALALGLLGTFYPAWQAGRLAPIEALKYE